MSLIKNNVDILMISETKLDESFPDGQFTVKGYSKPFRLDRNKNGGGIMLYVREDIPARLISVEKSPIEAIFIEINLRNRKWLFCCSYNPNKATTERHIEALIRVLICIPPYMTILYFLEISMQLLRKLQLRIFVTSII